MINNDQLILTLELKNNEKIKIYSDDKFQAIDPYSYTAVIFHKNNQFYTLEGNFLYPLHHFLLALQKLLREGLLFKLKLDDSIIQDIGYLWHVWIYGDETSLVCSTDKNNHTYWIGQEYELSSGEYMSWIYNDEQGHIIFKITPTYRYFDRDDDQEVKKFQNWMKSYQPLFTTIISQETAQQWLKQTEAILEEIDKNMAKRIAAR